MRPKLMGAPNTLDGTDRDADGLGHGAGGQVRRFVRRLGVGQSDSPRDDPNARRPRLVASQAVDPFRHEPLLPAPDAGRGFAGLAHHRVGSRTGGGEKHDLRRQTCF
jgi:hypothetical protein